MVFISYCFNIIFIYSHSYLNTPNIWKYIYISSKLVSLLGHFCKQHGVVNKAGGRKYSINIDMALVKVDCSISKPDWVSYFGKQNAKCKDIHYCQTG